jgi:hypothetical protein
VSGSQQLCLDFSDIATDGLSFHTFVRALKDFNSEDSSDMKRILKIYNLYTEYGSHNRGFIRLGRQFLSFGVGKGSIDGATGQLVIPGMARLTAFAGLGVQSESLSVQAWEESRTLGGQLSVQYLHKTDITASFVEKAVRDTSTEQKMRLDLRTELRPGLRPYVGADFDFVESTLSRLYAGFADNRTDKLSSYINYSYLKPAFPKNSFFHKLENEGYSRVRAGVTFNPAWVADFTVTFVSSIYETDNAHYLEVSADGEWLSLGAGHSFGYGGERTGVFASASYPVFKTLNLDAGLDYAVYRFTEEDAVSSDENDIAGYTGAKWKPFANVDIGARVENLVNQDYEYDVRFVSNISIGFGF